MTKKEIISQLQKISHSIFNEGMGWASIDDLIRKIQEDIQDEPTSEMDVSEALKIYDAGLEKSLNHPLLIQDSKLKTLVKLLACSAFETAWNSCLASQDKMTAEDMERIKSEMAKKYHVS